MSDPIKSAAVKLAAGAALRRYSSWRWHEYAFWIFALLMVFLVPSRLLLLNEVAIMALLALSLDLILGYAGIVSLGHGAFFGVGAYTAGLVAKHFAGHFLLADPIIGLLLAGIGAGLAGFVSSFLVLRGADLTRLMVTLGIALIIGEVANKFSGITGGSDGLQGVIPGKILGIFEFDLAGRNAYLYSLSVLFILFLLARRIVHSSFGLSLKAIKGNPLRSRAIGMPVERRLIAIYTIAAIYAGIAGALLAQTTQFVSLDVLEFHRSADAMLMLVFGGAGVLYGGIIGAIVFTVIHDVLKDITPQYWQFWLGLSLVLLVLFAQGGITGLLDALRRKMTKLQGKIS